MAQQILSTHKHLQSVSYTLPNKHYVPVDMRYVGVENMKPCVLFNDFVFNFPSFYLLHLLSSSLFKYVRPPFLFLSSAPPQLRASNPRTPVAWMPQTRVILTIHECPHPRMAYPPPHCFAIPRLSPPSSPPCRLADPPILAKQPTLELKRRLLITVQYPILWASSTNCSLLTSRSFPLSVLRAFHRALLLNLLHHPPYSWLLFLCFVSLAVFFLLVRHSSTNRRSCDSHRCT